MSERNREEGGRKAPWKPLWSDLSNKIDRELPGEPLWSQAIPIEDGDVAEGIAIRREGSPGGSLEGDPNGDAEVGREPRAAWYLLVYFRLVPVSVGPSGEMIGGESADDWDIEVGYQEPFDTLPEAKHEAGEILAGLPTPEHMHGRGHDFFLKLLKP